MTRLACVLALALALALAPALAGCDQRPADYYRPVELLAPSVLGDDVVFVERERSALYRIPTDALRRQQELAVQVHALRGEPVGQPMRAGDGADELLLLVDGDEPALHAFGPDGAHRAVPLDRPYTAMARSIDGDVIALYVDDHLDTDSFTGNTHLGVVDLGRAARDCAGTRGAPYLDFAVTGLGEPPTEVAVSGTTSRDGPLLGVRFETHGVVATLDECLQDVSLRDIGLDEDEPRPTDMEVSEQWVAFTGRDGSDGVLRATPDARTRPIDGLFYPETLASTHVVQDDGVAYLITLSREDRGTLRAVAFDPVDRMEASRALSVEQANEIIAYTDGADTFAVVYSLQGDGDLALIRFDGYEEVELLRELPQLGASSLQLAVAGADATPCAAERLSPSAVLTFHDGGLGVLTLADGTLSTTARNLVLSKLTVDPERCRAIAAADDGALVVVRLHDGHVQRVELGAPIEHILVAQDLIVVSHPSSFGHLSAIVDDDGELGAVREHVGFLASVLGGEP